MNTTREKPKGGSLTLSDMSPAEYEALREMVTRYIDEMTYSSKASVDMAKNIKAAL